MVTASGDVTVLSPFHPELSSLDVRSGREAEADYRKNRSGPLAGDLPQDISLGRFLGRVKQGREVYAFLAGTACPRSQESGVRSQKPLSTVH